MIPDKKRVRKDISLVCASEGLKCIRTGLCNEQPSTISTHVSDLFHSKESFGRRRGD